MTDKAEIKKIVLELGGVEVSITPSQAKKLHQLLDEMYGTKTITFSTPPIYIKNERWWWDRPQLMWSSDQGTSITYSEDTQIMCMAVD